MITIEMLLAMKENDGLTLRKHKAINYKSGYQVATEGIETRSAAQALKAIIAYNGTCGLWYSGGVYYVDKSHRVSTKREALTVGRAHNQICILQWNQMKCVYC